ncbi:MAG: hypothetical protein AB1894_09250 [Chloroflexota bacterium]
METKKTSLLLTYLLVLAVGLAACTAQTGTPLPASPIPAGPTQPPATATPLPAGVLAAQKAAAARLSVSPGVITVKSFESVEWPDSCLDFPARDEVCAPTVTPGYSGLLFSEVEQFEFHSDLQGQQVRLIPGSALAARHVLARELDISEDQVRIVSAEPMEWPDACLGLKVAELVCTPGATPGYLVQLLANDSQHEYRTDRAGFNILPVVAQNTTPSLSWTQTGADGCEQATITDDGVAYAACESQPASAPFIDPQRAVDLAKFVELFAAFQADTVAGAIQFTGRGQVTATPWQQRMLAEWARLVVQENKAGRSDPTQGLVIKWRTQNSAGDSCSNVRLYLSGEAIVDNCADLDTARFWLVTSQLQTLYNWLASLSSFELTQTEFLAEGSQTTTLNFYSLGQVSASELDQRTMAGLAGEMLTRSTLQPDPADLPAARQALQDYILALAEQRYADAANLYAGDYQVLRNNNSNIPADDSAALFQAACTLNGFICNVSWRNEVQAAPIAPDKYRFSIELSGADGNMFALGPCCGADPQVEPPLTQFDFIVVKVDGRFLIESLPVYTP